MEASRFLVSVDLRRRWRSWLALVVLFGVIGGLGIASFAGWRRTATAMDRFLDHHRPSNAFVEGQLSPEDLAALPGVEAVLGGDYFLLVPLDGDGRPQPERLGTVSPFSHDDRERARAYERPIVVAGRLADPDVASEVTIDEEMAGLYGLEPGSTFSMQAYSPEQAPELFESIGSLPPEGRRFEFTVAGVIREPADVVRRPSVPDVVYLGSAAVHLGPAFHEAHWRRDVASLGALFDVPGGGGGFGLIVDPSVTSRDELTEGVLALDPDALVDHSAVESEQAAQEADRAIGLQAGAVLAFGALVTLGGLVLGAQALRRHLAEDAHEREVWRALGRSRRQVAATVATKGAFIGAGAALLAVVVSAALSPLTPVGVARRAETDPGPQVHLVATLVGALLVSVLVALGFAVLASRTAQPSASTRDAPGGVGLADRAARLGLPVPVVAGLRSASVGRGGRTVSGTVLVAAAGVVGALVFVASEARLAEDRDLWGWEYDVVVGDGNDPGLVDRALASLPTDPRVERMAVVHDLEVVTVRAGGRSAEVDGAALEPVVGDLSVAVTAGTAPLTDGHIALGGATARSLGVDVGDEVDVDLGRGPTTFTVSGLAVMNLGLDADRIGEGSVLTPGGIERAGGELAPVFFVLDASDDVDLDVLYDDLRAQWGNTVLRPLRPLDVDQLHQVRHLPLAFSAVLAVVAAGTLAFVLTRTVQHRRRDLALLRTLGFESRQLRGSVIAQATALVLPATLIGAVGGVVGGRLAWAAVTQGMGAPTVQVMPALSVAAVVVAVLVVANLVAALPARRAAIAHPATVLRAE